MTIDEKDLEIARLRGQVEALERTLDSYRAVTRVLLADEGSLDVAEWRPITAGWKSKS
jgi:hypothetical protein